MIIEAMKLGCRVLFSMLIRICCAKHCTNQCSDKQEDWCGEKRMIDGQVKHCVERSRLVHLSDFIYTVFRYGFRCLTPCQMKDTKYSWCQSGVISRFWDYCASVGFSSYGKKCVGECIFEKYWWCRTNTENESEWDYCSPTSQVYFLGKVMDLIE